MSAYYVYVNHAPDEPTDPSPADGATTVSRSTLLAWTGGDPDGGDTVTYDVYLEANDSSPDILICNDVSSTMCNPGTLAYGTHYYWYVIVTDSHGATETSSTWDFTTNSLPNIPSSPSPSDGATGVSTSADLSWTGGDPDPGDEVTYDVYFGDSDPPGTILCPDTTLTTCDPGALAYNTHYYWYVVATDEHGATIFGSTWEFTTGSEPNEAPDTPRWPSPLTGATGVSRTADLSWTGGDPDPGDTVTYDVYFEAYDMTPDTLLCDDVSSASCDPGTMDYGSHYYWKVIATDNHGATTAGDTWHFTTNSLPYIPGSPSPSDGATGVSTSADLSWSGGDPDSGDTVTYDVYVKAGASAPYTLLCPDTPQTTCDPGALAYDSHYYWYVVATDNHGLTIFGDVWEFHTAAQSVVGPLVYDSHVVDDDMSTSQGNDNGIVDCGETIELNITLRNQGSDTATDVAATLSTSDAYVTLTDSVEDFPHILGGGTGEDVFDYDFVVDPATPDGHIITFDLAISASNGGPWSDSFEVPVTCVSNDPPHEPSNPSPSDGATEVSTSTDLSWSGGDPDSGDTVTYDVYLDIDNTTPNVLVCDDVTSASCDPGILQYGSHYYWTVVATDNHGATRTGSTWDFTTGSAPNNPPYEPNSPSPSDGATGVSTTTTLSWLGGDPDPGDTVTYHVYVDTDQVPTIPTCEDLTTPTCDPGPLEYGTRYYWYVFAVDSHSTWVGSDTWEFVTEDQLVVGPLVYDSHTIDDDMSTSQGNDDGVANCGERIELNVMLRNQGSDTATGVSAVLSTSDAYVTMTDSVENFPNILGGGTGEDVYDYDFSVDPDTPDGHRITFDLDISAASGGPWNDSFEVPVTCVGDAYEPDDAWSEASWIYDGLDQEHSIEPETDVDWVKFSLPALSQVVIETSGTGGDTRMWLYDASLVQVEYDDDDGTGLCSRVDRLCGVDALPAGTYYVKIDEYGNNSEIDSYTVSYAVEQVCSVVYVPVVLRR